METAPILIAIFGGLALLLAGLVLLCLVRILSAPREIAGDEPELVVLVVLGWVLLLTGVGAATLFLSFAVMGAGGIVVVAAAPVVFLMAYFRHRRARQHALLSAMAAAAKRLMPLAPVVDAFAEEWWGLMGHRARRLAALLRAGMSLPDALYRTPWLVSRQDQVTIRVGQESGSLAAALSDVVRSHDLHAPVWNQMMGRGLYLCGVVVFASLIVVPFMMLKLAPEFRKIFEEFEAPLPPITEWVFAAAHLFEYCGFFTVPLLLFVMLIFLLLVIQYVLGTRFSLPILNRLTRRLDTAVILEALALAAERNVAFATGIATMARWYPRGWIRRRLQAVLQEMSAGGDWSQSLARWGLIRPVELAVFQSAGRAGNLAWALREMADSNRRRLNYRMYLLVQLLFPLAIVAIALLIMVYILSFFLPLISLIQNLT
ncbi:MAG TPA: type II secretion system F family protein [Thermoguttaceae bacterium]|nr:type II secretion system F family protein [Thermoguttaceae bacterium]